MSERSTITKVYVVARVVDSVLVGPVKAGRSLTPETRVRQLQTGCPDQLAIAHIFTVPSREWAARMETVFAVRHATKRLQGEWYDLAPVMAIASMGLILFYAIIEGRDPVEDGDEISGLLSRSGVACIPTSYLRNEGEQ